MMQRELTTRIKSIRKLLDSYGTVYVATKVLKLLPKDITDILNNALGKITYNNGTIYNTLSEIAAYPDHEERTYQDSMDLELGKGSKIKNDYERASV